MPRTACEVRLDTGPCGSISFGCHVQGVAGFIKRILCIEWSKNLKRKLREARITDNVEKFHVRSRQIYGYRKVHKDLIEETEHRRSDELVRRIML